MLFDKAFITQFNKIPYAECQEAILTCIQISIGVEFTVDLCIEAINENCLIKLEWLLAHKCPLNLKAFEIAIQNGNLLIFQYLLDYALEHNILLRQNTASKLVQHIVQFAANDERYSLDEYIDILVKYALTKKKKMILCYLRDKFGLTFQINIFLLSIMIGDFSCYEYVKNHLESLDHLSPFEKEMCSLSFYVKAIKYDHFDIFADLNKSGLFVLDGLLRELKCQIICSGKLTYIDYMFEHVPQGKKLDEFFIHCAEKTGDSKIVRRIEQCLHIQSDLNRHSIGRKRPAQNELVLSV